MAEILTNFGLDLHLLFAAMTISAVLVFLLYRSFLFSLIDPLLLFMVAQVGNCSIMFALKVDAKEKWYFLFYVIALWVGFAMNGKPTRKFAPSNYSTHSLFDLKLLLTLLCGIIVLANLYLGLTAGFPLLSGDPSNEKFTVYSGGLGFVRRFNMGPYYFLCAGCMLMIICNQSRKWMLALIGMATSLVMLGGSKSAILPALFSLSFAVSHRGLAATPDFRRRIKKYLIALLGLGTVLGVVVTVKDQGGLVAGIQGFVLRFLLAGDVNLFYYPRREQIAALVTPNAWGYLQNVFADILSLLRVGDYNAALGSIIQGTESGGPNVQYFIHADLFFGAVAGIFYCFAIGFVMSWLRKRFFAKEHSSAFAAALGLFGALIAFDLATEAGLFFTEAFVAMACVLPLYFLIMTFRLAFHDLNLIRGLVGVPAERSTQGKNF